MRQLRRTEIICITAVVMWTEYLTVDFVQWQVRSEMARSLQEALQLRPGIAAPQLERGAPVVPRL
jgi:hypothetical protein